MKNVHSAIDGLGEEFLVLGTGIVKCLSWFVERIAPLIFLTHPVDAEHQYQNHHDQQEDRSTNDSYKIQLSYVKTYFLSNRRENNVTKHLYHFVSG